MQDIGAELDTLGNINMAKELFRTDSYTRECDAEIIAVTESGIRLDQTVFYPMGGGQPGDTGSLRLPDGTSIRIVDTQKSEDGADICHLYEQPVSADLVGRRVTAVIDWERRHRLMRMHSCLHLLSAVIPVGVTGGSVRDGSGRLDFDLPDSVLDKDHITNELNRLIIEDHAVSISWISDDVIKSQPELV